MVGNVDFIQKIESSQTNKQSNQPISRQPNNPPTNNPTNKQSNQQTIQPTNKPMNNNDTSYYYYNDVKFTGSAIESPSDVVTTLLYIALLIMLAMGEINPNHE